MKKIKFILVAMIATLGLALSVPKVFASNDIVAYLEKHDGNTLYGDTEFKQGDVLNLNKVSGSMHNGKQITFGPDEPYVSQNGFRIEFNEEIELKKLDGSPIYTESSFKIEYGDLLSISKVSSVELNGQRISFGPDEAYVSQNGFKIITTANRGDKAPALTGEHTVVANVDSPYTIDRIKEIAELTATDEYYGDLTDQIEVISDNYTDNATKVGNYEIEFKVTNDSNLSTTFKLIVAVKDLVAPVITGPATSEISYTEVLNLEAFLTDFNVTDNHDETVLLKVDSNTYVGNEEIPGTYQIKLSATDTSKNKGTFTHTIKVIDDVKPNFVDEHTGKITVNWRDKIDDNFLLLDLTANDKIDGDLTNEIKIVDRGGLKNELGSYNVKYEVTDATGNKSTYTRKYEIITTDAPVFWVSKNLLLISDVNILTNDQLANELASYENIKMASFVMIQNDYTGNEDIPGEYEVKVAIADTDGTEHQISRTIRVFAEEEMPEAEPNFIDKVINFFVNVWNMIVKVFMWFVNAIKWLWNLIFGWVN